MIKYAYNLSQEVKDFFNADRLVQVALASRSARDGKWYHHRNKTPGTILFHNVTVFPVSEHLFELKSRNRTVAVMEKTGQGAEWRHYTGPSIASARVIRLLVEGNSEVDLFYANPGIEVINETKRTENGLVSTSTVKNITILNGLPWQEVENNLDIQGIGVNWFVRGVDNLTYRQGGFIANGNIVDLNRGSGRKEFCKISTDPNIPLTTDFKTDSEISEYKADYILREQDILDPDVEALSMTVYHGLKQTISPITIPLNSIL